MNADVLELDQDGHYLVAVGQDKVRIKVHIYLATEFSC